NHPKVLLLDEPLGALDAFTRMRMQDEVLRLWSGGRSDTSVRVRPEIVSERLLRLWQSRRTTMILVTHDIDEAIYMSDRIVIMSPRPGKVERIIDVTLDRPRDRSSP